MSLRGPVGPIAASFTAILVACSSGSGSTSLDRTGGTTARPLPTATTGTGEPSGSTAVPQAIVTAKLRAAPTGACSQAGQSFMVGGFTPPTPVAKGVSEPRGTVNVICKVTPFSSGFAVDAVVDVADGAGGALSFAGNTTATGTASGNFVGGFHLPGLDYESGACTLDPNAATGGAGGIAAGRFWTTFHCAGARTNGSYDLCEIDGEIRLENCAQR